MKRVKKKILHFFKNPKKVIDKKHIYEYLLVVILIVGIFFRFYNTPMRYVLDFDPTRDALINIVGENEFKFPQVGPKSGVAEFTFGPWYYYQTIIFSILTPFDYAPWIYIGITSVVTVFLYYLIGRFLEDKKLGLIIAGLVAITPSELGPITGLSNPNLIPIQAAITLLLFVLFLKKRIQFYWIIFWGFIVGVGINNHYQAAGLLILPAIAFLVRPKQLLQNSILFLIGLFISFIPLLTFNMNHDWHTVRGFLNYSEHGRTGASDRWLFYIRDFWPKFASYVLGINTMFGYVIFSYISIVLAFYFVKKKIKFIYVLLFICFILNILFLRYATSIRENYYYIYMHGFIFIFFGLAIWYSLKNRMTLLLSVLLISGMAFMILKEDFRRLKSENFVVDLHENKETIMRRNPGSFQIYSCGDRSKTNAQGLVFLLYHEGKLSNHGKKIGIISDDCLDPTVYTRHKLSWQWVYVDLEANSSDILKQYWIRTTPESVYKNNLEWWRNK